MKWFCDTFCIPSTLGKIIGFQQCHTTSSSTIELKPSKGFSSLQLGQQQQKKPLTMSQSAQSTFSMPLCSDHTTPVFNSTKPQELLRFFNDLEYLFKCTSITNNTEKKEGLMCYVNIGVQCLWKAILEYKVTMTSFADFKKAVLKYYPEASGDFIYTLRNMDVDLIIGLTDNKYGWTRK